MITDPLGSTPGRAGAARLVHMITMSSFRSDRAQLVVEGIALLGAQGGVDDDTARRMLEALTVRGGGAWRSCASSRCPTTSGSATCR